MQRRPFPQRLRAALGVLFDSTNWQHRISRPLEVSSNRPIHEEVNPSDLAVMRSDSRKLYANVGPVKGAVDGKAMYAVGRSWLPKFEGADVAWGKEAREWLLNEWYPLADIAGNDFQTALYLLSTSADVEGDAGAMLTEYETGFPAVQLFSGLTIGNRKQKQGVELTAGEYKGLKIFDGVVLNPQGRAVAYHLLGDASDGSEDQFVSARDFQLIKEPQFIGQPRGFPAFASAILDLKDLRTVQGYEKSASMLAASIGLIEWNESGLADMTDPKHGLDGNNSPSPTVTREMEGGTVKLYKAGTGAKLEQFMAARPGDAFERLRDHLIRSAMSSINWHYELAWDISKLGGANTRFIISSAMRTVEDRQDLLKPFAKRAVGYAVAKAIKLGRLRKSEDWWKWGFTMPARMTADYGRDKQQDREDYINGVINLGDICAENGTDLDQHIAERAEENKKLKAAGLPVPMTAQQTQIEVAEKQAAINGAGGGSELKAAMDAYGVGVRAGAITPTLTDEEHFRKEAGLPPVNEDVLSAWEDDEGTRRPITLTPNKDTVAVAAGSPPPEDPSAKGELSRKAPQLFTTPAKIDGADIQACAAIAELEQFVADYKIVEQLHATLPNNG